MPARRDDSAYGLRIWLLGGFRVAAGAREVAAGAWRLRKAKNLVKLLALAPRHRLHREQIIEILWPDLRAEAAANNLRRALHVARRALGGSPWLVMQDDVLQLPADDVWIDVDDFENAAANAKRRREIAAYRVALAAYAGELLPEDQYEDWAGERREALRQTHVMLLVELAGAYESEGERDRAIETLKQVLARDAAREDAHRELMRLYALSGHRQDALRQYRAVEEVMRREFDTAPEPTTQRLHEEITAGRAPYDASAVPPRVEPPAVLAPSRRTNLPLPLTSFVGRARELAELHERLAMGRQLTLTGSGGVGKTRLALEVAGRAVQEFPDGVWLVDLSSLVDPALVPAAVAAALEVEERSNRPLGRALEEYFRSKHALLLFDNCEHLVSACAQLGEYLLRRCPDLHLLITSREVLGMAGESVYRVSSLSAPDARRPPAAADLLEYEAVRLFVERAGLSEPGFALTSDNAAMVGRICTDLDGIPLAIELAAARLKALPVEVIAARLSDRFRLLTGGTRTTLSRHQTLRAAMDWSYDLLPEQERTLLRILSVFGGGFTIEAAQAVGTHAGVDEIDVLDGLTQLVDKSMVLMSNGRYRCLETVRQYLRGRLVDAGEAIDARRRHAAFYLALAQRAEPELRRADQAAWLDRLETEHDNLRAALEWFLGQRGDDGAPWMAAALAGYWHARGYLTEGRDWMERALAHECGVNPLLRMHVLTGAARLAFSQDDFEHTVALLEQAVPIARAAADHEALTRCLAWLGHAMFHAGDTTRGMALVEESQALCASVSDDWTRAVVLAEVATMALHQQESELAAGLLEESLAQFRRVGDTGGIAQCLYQLGLQAVNRADYGRARKFIEEGLTLQRQLGRRPAVAASLGRLGRIALVQGDYGRATTLLESAIALADELGKQWDAVYRTGLGLAVLAQGDPIRAGTVLEECLALQRRFGNKPFIADALAALGVLNRYAGDGARARRLLEESAALVEALGSGDLATPRYHLGLVACADGDDGAAAQLLRDSLRRRMGAGDTLGAAECLEGLASVARVRRAWDDAVRLLAAAEAARTAIGAPRWPVDQTRYEEDMAALRQALGDEPFAAAWRRGEAAGLHAAAEILLAPS